MIDNFYGISADHYRDTRTDAHGNLMFVFFTGEEYGNLSVDLSDYRQEVSLSIFYLSKGLKLHASITQMRFEISDYCELRNHMFGVSNRSLVSRRDRDS